MNKILKMVLLGFFFTFSSRLYALELPINTTNIVKKSISAAMEGNAIPGIAVELYVEAKPYSYYFGYGNQDNKIPVTGKTIFELGSLSKIMTSLLLAQEIDIAKMNLNDSLTKYLPDLPAGFSDINLQTLATHTSGLPFSVPKNITTIGELHRYLTKWSPDDAPGERWTYSNFGVGLLGYALEGSTHQNFNQLYRRHILNPLGMQAIGFTVPAALKKYYAQGYDENGNPVQPSSSGVFPTAYAVKASANDMQHFLKAAIGLSGTSDRIFYPIRMTQTAYVKVADIMQGLGWQIQPITPENVPKLLAFNQSNGPILIDEIYDKPVFNGDALIDKTGSTNGFSAYIAVIPNKKSGIVILANKNVPQAVIVNTAREILFKATHLIADQAKN